MNETPIPVRLAPDGWKVGSIYTPPNATTISVTYMLPTNKEVRQVFADVGEQCSPRIVRHHYPRRIGVLENWIMAVYWSTPEASFAAQGPRSFERPERPEAPE